MDRSLSTQTHDGGCIIPLLMLAMEKTRKTKENSQSNKRVSILAEAADSQAKGDFNHHRKLGWFRRPVTNYPRCKLQKMMKSQCKEREIK